DQLVLRQGTETVSGLSTYVELLGTLTSTAPPLVLLHGGPGLSHEYLLPHMLFLATGRLLVLYDMRAMGESGVSDGTRSSTITMAQHAADLGNLLAHLM